MTERTYATRIDELAVEHPDAVALRVTGDPARSLTWGELARRSAGLARRFAARGVRPRDVISIALPNGTGHVLCTVGAWRLGATVLPLRPELPAPERARLLDLARPALHVGEGASPADGLTEEEVLACPELDPTALAPAPAVSPAWLIASGGSTGSPKLIAPTTSSTALGAAGFGFAEGPSQFADNADHRHPVHLVCAPLSHTHAFVLLHGTLVGDFRVVLMPRFDAEALLDLIEKERVAFTALVPTMLIRLLRSPTIRSRDLSSLQNVVLGAGATPDWAIREGIEVIGPTRLLMGYGSSEGVAAAFIRGDEWLEHPGSVGKLVNSTVRVVGEDGQELPTGEVGELYFKPHSGQRGFRYIGKAAARTLPGGYVSIGDLGRVDGDGYLYISDRRSDMIVTGGANVYAAEVEAALLAHPDVADAVVIGLPDPEWSRRVHALVQLRPGADGAAALESLPAHCKQHLAAYKAPRSYEIVADVGRSDSGKVNRQALARAREQEIR